MSAVTAIHALFHCGTSNPSDAVLAAPPDLVAFCPGSNRKPIVNGTRRILVIGGAGAVGGMVVQLAALAGAGLVAATCSRKNMAFVQSLGAYIAIAYDQEGEQESHLARYKYYFHGVVDCVGGEALREAWLCVRPGGKLISIVDNPVDFTPPGGGEAAGVKSGFFSTKPNRQYLQFISILIAEGVLQPIFSPENVLEFDQYNEVNEKLVCKERGKLVLRINNEEPWDVIKLLDEFGSVPALPGPEVAPPRRPRGKTTEEILAEYEGNRARYRKMAEARTGKNQKRTNNRPTDKEKEDAGAGSRDAGEESGGEEESETEGEEGQEERTLVNEDALLPNPWEVNPRGPRKEEQEENSNQPPASEMAETSVGLKIQEPAHGRPKYVPLSRQAANEARRKAAEYISRKLFEGVEAKRAAEEAARVTRESVEAEEVRRLEQALLNSLPANASKLDRARVRDQIIRIKLYGEEDAFKDQSGPSRWKGRRDGDFKLPSWLLNEKGGNGEDSDKHADDHFGSQIGRQARGKQRAVFVDYGYQVVEASPQKQQEGDDGKQDDTGDSGDSHEDKQMIGIKRPAEGDLEVTEKDLLNLEGSDRKKHKASKTVPPAAVAEYSPAVKDTSDPMEIDGDDEAPPLMEIDNVSMGLVLPNSRPGQAKSAASVPFPPWPYKGPHPAGLDVHMDTQHLVRKNRHFVNSIENLPKNRLRRNRPPGESKYGTLSEEAITLTIVQKADGSVGYKKKSDLERPMQEIYGTDQSPLASPQQSSPWGSGDDRILVAALGAEIGKGKETARRSPAPVPV